jgi:hypothetical protein
MWRAPLPTDTDGGPSHVRYGRFRASDNTCLTGRAVIRATCQCSVNYVSEGSLPLRQNRFLKKVSELPKTGAAARGVEGAQRVHEIRGQNLTP